jgi:hypothetical protein
MCPVPKSRKDGMEAGLSKKRKVVVTKGKGKEKEVGARVGCGQWS